MNLLTDEECKIVAELSKNPSLNLKGATHTYRYFGVDREPNIKNIELLESILIKWCPSLVKFSNFTADEPNRIRIQAKYSDYFTGVHYLDLPSNNTKHELIKKCRK